MNLIQRFPVQQGHILNIGGDALIVDSPNFSRPVCTQIKVISVHYNGYGINNVNGTRFWHNSCALCEHSKLPILIPKTKNEGL